MEAAEEARRRERADERRREAYRLCRALVMVLFEGTPVAPDIISAAADFAKNMDDAVEQHALRVALNKHGVSIEYDYRLARI